MNGNTQDKKTTTPKPKNMIATISATPEEKERPRKHLATKAARKESPKDDITNDEETKDVDTEDAKKDDQSLKEVASVKKVDERVPYTQVEKTKDPKDDTDELLTQTIEGISVTKKEETETIKTIAMDSDEKIVEEETVEKKTVEKKTVEEKKRKRTEGGEGDAKIAKSDDREKIVEALKKTNPSYYRFPIELGSDAVVKMSSAFNEAQLVTWNNCLEAKIFVTDENDNNPSVLVRCDDKARSLKTITQMINNVMDYGNPTLLLNESWLNDCEMAGILVPVNEKHLHLTMCDLQVKMFARLKNCTGFKAIVCTTGGFHKVPENKALLDALFGKSGFTGNMWVLNYLYGDEVKKLTFEKGVKSLALKEKTRKIIHISCTDMEEKSGGTRYQNLVEMGLNQFIKTLLSEIDNIPKSKTK